MQPMEPIQPTQGRGKEKMVAGILGILLGSLGVHHFYLGSMVTGVIEIVVTFCTCGIGSLVGLVEGILLLVMSDEEFNQRYNYRTPESVEFVFMKPKTMGGGGVPPTPPPPPYQS
jgi:TM2 domain-containing membrane protein YozV